MNVVLGCIKCKRDDVIFKPQRGKKTTLVCQSCKNARWRNWYKDNILKQRTKACQKSRNRLAGLKQLIIELKSKPCMDCKKKYPYYVMDFDHRTNKKFNISYMVNSRYSIENIQAEIDKCDLVCANCHRIRTQFRINGL